MPSTITGKPVTPSDVSATTLDSLLIRLSNEIDFFSGNTARYMRVRNKLQPVGSIDNKGDKDETHEGSLNRLSHMIDTVNLLNEMNYGIGLDLESAV